MNIDALERDLKRVSDQARTTFESQAKTAETDKRERTPEEKAEVQKLLDEAKALKERIESAKLDEGQRAEIERLSGGMAAPAEETRRREDDAKRARTPQTLGEQFVASAAGEFLRKGGHRKAGSAWTSPSVELKATTLDTTSGSGGQLIVSDYRPGILPILFKRLVVADLLASGQTDSNSITYMRETTFTNAAAAVAEGTAKPESTLIFDQVTDLVRKIAHWLPVTDEMLEDVAQIRSYIDARLRLGLDLTEEDQLLNGSGVAPNITGLMNRAGLAAAQARGADTNVDAIFKQITNILTTSFIQPDGIVINPTNWQTIVLSKDSQGQYYGAGPFAPPQNYTLWGLPVVPTPSIVANTALVGAYRQGAQVFRKGGIRVEASNSHADFFVKNLTAIRAEERLALAVYRPAGFGKVTGLN